MRDLMKNIIFKNTSILVIIVVLIQCLKFIPGLSMSSTYGQLLIYSLINCILLISVYKTNLYGAITLSIITPITGILLGQVWIRLLPVVILSNILMVCTFYYFKKYNEYLAAITGGILKWGFAYLIFNYLYKAIKLELPASLKELYNLPQFYVVLIGAVLSVMVFKFINDSLKLGHAIK